MVAASFLSSHARHCVAIDHVHSALRGTFDVMRGDLGAHHDLAVHGMRRDLRNLWLPVKIRTAYPVAQKHRNDFYRQVNIKRKDSCVLIAFAKDHESFPLPGGMWWYNLSETFVNSTMAIVRGGKWDNPLYRVDDQNEDFAGTRRPGFFESTRGGF